MSGSLLQAVDIIRTNSKEELQAMTDRWYECGYVVHFEHQSERVCLGQYVLVAYVVTDRKEIFG